MVKCPRCAESIKPQAKICRHCGHSFGRKTAQSSQPLPGPKEGCFAAIMLVGIATLLFNCMGSDEPTDADEQVAVEAPLTDVEVAEKEVSGLAERLEGVSATCEHGPPRDDPDGEIALAETDIAMADSMGNISQEQEWRIRASLGAEMGLAPSQVDGWRQIYRSRAEQARRLIARTEAEERERQEAACDYVPELKSELAQARQRLRKVQRTQ